MVYQLFKFYIVVSKTKNTVIFVVEKSNIKIVLILFKAGDVIMATWIGQISNKN